MLFAMPRGRSTGQRRAMDHGLASSPTAATQLIRVLINAIIHDEGPTVIG